MGLIRAIFGGGAQSVGTAITNVAEVFTPNATRQMELGHERYVAALDQHGTEFEHGRLGLFDRLMNGLNRLPRPMLALGTLGLFVYAMVDPAAFSARMQGLAYVPDPLWWLLGAIVSFYFGAREMYYLRGGTDKTPAPKAAPKRPTKPTAAPARKPARSSGSDNPALTAWRAGRSHQKK
ncbi:holin family protein [Litoreibacter roseus]|uniref:Holin of 3TMs, for gene-transfer release n=1 Tax=Litoreibacter roseus TaxID=2601869 RepID=A0A6N6JLK8_9RHOB|nr:holin family protein [Litoreibacter roseus]GFE66847.1 hypothetical protein KIN_39210 [Litoreibacter roseus]